MKCFHCFWSQVKHWHLSIPLSIWDPPYPALIMQWPRGWSDRTGGRWDTGPEAHVGADSSVVWSVPVGSICTCVHRGVSCMCRLHVGCGFSGYSVCLMLCVCVVSIGGVCVLCGMYMECAQILHAFAVGVAWVLCGMWCDVVCVHVCMYSMHGFCGICAVLNSMCGTSEWCVICCICVSILHVVCMCSVWV